MRLFLCGVLCGLVVEEEGFGFVEAAFCVFGFEGVAEIAEFCAVEDVGCFAFFAGVDFVQVGDGEVVVAEGVEGDAVGLEICEWVSSPCMAVVDGFRDEGAGEDDGAAVAGVVRVDPFGFGGLESAVFTGDGEADDGAIVEGDDFEASHFEDQLWTFGFRVFDGWWQPADLVGFSVLGDEGPCGDALADGDFDLGMIP